jgi:WD40 repeat protein
MTSTKFLLPGLIASNLLVVFVGVTMWFHGEWDREDEPAPKTIPVVLLRGHDSPVRALAFAPDGRTLASAGGVYFRSGEVRLWDVAQGKELSRLPGYTEAVQAVTFSPDGRLLATATTDGGLRVWALTPPQLRAVVPGNLRCPSSLTFCRDGQVAAGLPGAVRARDLATGVEHVLFRGEGGTMAMSPHGTLVASGWDGNGNLSLRDLARGRERAYRPPPVAVVCRLGFSPDGRLLAASYYTGAIQVWDTGNHRLRHTLHGHEGWVACLAFSPDGRTLASAGQDRIIRLWDLATAQEKRQVVGHTGPVESLAFAPDGKLLASGSYDKTVRVWDLVDDARDFARCSCAA